MKKYGKKMMNKYVIFALLLVLFISLGALTMQGTREGYKHTPKKTKKDATLPDDADATPSVAATSSDENPILTK